MKNIRSNALLLTAAILWGFAFVAQRVGMAHVGAFTFNGVRFALGSISLVPLILINQKRQAADESSPANIRTVILGGCLAGSVLFVGASLHWTLNKLVS